MMTKYALLLTTLVMMLLSATSQAQEPRYFTPEDANYVVATWDEDETPSEPMDEVASLLNEAKYIGNSDFYARASILLEQVKETQSEDPVWRYYSAVTKQYYHQFSNSAQILKDLLLTHPEYANARLLLANLYAVQGDFKQAKNMCRSLVTTTEAVLVAACSLNIDAQQGNVSQSLDSLTEFTNKYQASNIETAVYIAEIKASMATYLNEFSLADSILSEFIDQKVPVSFWVLWSDIQLALNQPENVLALLGGLVKQTKNQDDALLLRLAIAEKRLELEYLVWEPKIEERMALREARNDEEHAFDLAVYYLDLNNDPETAYKWATINWQQAKLREDAQLLKQTKEALEKLQRILNRIEERGTIL